MGTAGRVEIEIPFNAPPDKPCRIWQQRDGEVEEVQFPPCNQYSLQADQFSSAVLNNAPVPTPLTDAVSNMRVIDAVFTSGKGNGWVALE